MPNLRHITLEDLSTRPFMYWANKPEEDCLERLFKFYEASNRLAPYYSREFVTELATVVKSWANAEK
jgi:hypothetical protein